MPVYFLVGPAAALVGIVAIWFVMRNRQTQKRSMYSSRRAQVERKVKAARQRTLAPGGRGDKAPSEAEIAAAVPAGMAATYQAPPAAPLQAWEAPATPPPATPAPAYAPQAPAYEPPPATEFTPAAASAAPPIAPPAPFEPAPFAEPAPPAGQPEWTPAPAEPEWTPTPAPPVADLSAAPPVEPMAPPTAAAEPISTPAGGGASWEIVGDAPKAEPDAPPPGKGKKDRDRDKDQAAQQGSPWQLASGDAPNEGDEGDDGPRKPNAAMALAQYAVLVVGLVMVLIGVLVMVANSKVT